MCMFYANSSFNTNRPFYLHYKIARFVANCSLPILSLSLSLFLFSFAVPVRPRRMVRETYFDAVATNTISNGKLTSYRQNQVHLSSPRSPTNFYFVFPFLLIHQSLAFKMGLKFKNHQSSVKSKRDASLFRRRVNAVRIINAVSSMLCYFIAFALAILHEARCCSLEHCSISYSLD